MKNNILKTIKSVILFVLLSLKFLNNSVSNILETAISKTSVKGEDIELTNFSEDTNLRSQTYVYRNIHMKPNLDILKIIFYQIKSDERFLKFGKNKVIMVYLTTDTGEYSFHHNVLITNDTTYDEYFNQIKDHINERYEAFAYRLDVAPIITVKIWNIDNVSNKVIKITKDARVILNKAPVLSRGFHTKVQKGKVEKNQKKYNVIRPLTQESSNVKDFITLDIETMSYKGIQVPVLVTIASKHGSTYFIINRDVDLEISIENMFELVFEYLLEITDEKSVVFTHNLGGFDGIFIYKYLSILFKPSEITSIIDDSNKFITITLTTNNKIVTFKDSLRIFPVSLNELCKIFNIPGKLHSYNKAHNSFDLFKNEEELKNFKLYALQDSQSLFLTLLAAQKEYWNNYKVDITTVVSIPSLAFKIFRLKYLKKDIPILSKLNDKFIRESYYGGATDIYKSQAKNIYYYDVNSLYPFAMKKPMPLNLIKNWPSKLASSIDLNKFFGFLEVVIECPKSVKRPVLPVKHNGKTIYPTGTWTGTDFSEELKAVLPLGYKIVKILHAKEFDTADLFSEYIDDMYKIKMTATGAPRWISKLLQNSLYGLFGRKHDMLQTKTIYKKDIGTYLVTNIIKSIIDINEDKCTLLMVNNISRNILSEINSSLNMEVSEYNKLVQASVAVASAITSYARIHMIQYKIDDSTIYTDTDSIFTTKPLPDLEVGIELGKMKDELDGGIIQEGCFLGIKQYGYWYYDKSGNKLEKSVWAGITRNSLTYKDVISLYNGGSITKNIESRFFKSIIKLAISIKSVEITIAWKPSKKLVNN